MKTCKNCKRIVNIETVTCPNCEGHDFKLNSIKICSLCGKVNEKKNKDCELCGKSFFRQAGEYEVMNAMNLLSQGERWKEPPDEMEEAITKKTPHEKYVAIKTQVEKAEDGDRCAIFIPGEIQEKPIVLLPNFEDSEKVDVYLVLANNEMPLDMGKVEISKEEDINSLNKKGKQRNKTSVAAFVLFWLNLTMICAFGLKIAANVMGFQIIAAAFGGGGAEGQAVLAAMESVSAFGRYAYLIYPILLGIIAVEVFLVLMFIKTKAGKGKKVFLIIMQSFIFAFAIGAYIISFTMIGGVSWQDIGAGMILLAACAFAGVFVSIFYRYPKTKKIKEKPIEKPFERTEQESDLDSELVSLGYEEDNA